MRKTVVLPGLIGLILSTAVPNMAGASGTWVGGMPPSVKLHVDSSKQSVDLRLPKKDELPDSVGVTFFDAFGNSTSIELKSQDVRASSNGEAHFAGRLAPDAQSFVGFEIRIPFPLAPPKIIRSDEMKRVE